MNDRQPPSDPDIDRASSAWLAYQATEDEQYDWVIELQDDWLIHGDYDSMWRFLLKVCTDVAKDDDDTIGMIGAGPLYDMIHTWPDEALASIEAEASQNPTLLRALSIVITSVPAVRDQIDAILANDTEPVNESDIQRTSYAWLAPRPIAPPPDWVVRWQEKRHGQGDYKIMWRFVLRLCEDVQDDDSEMFRMIGLDSLWLMVTT
jgi:hypothetical protein